MRMNKTRRKIKKKTRETSKIMTTRKRAMKTKANRKRAARKAGAKHRRRKGNHKVRIP